MSHVRTFYGVPAKRGAKVRVIDGQHKGWIGRVLRATSAGHLVVRDLGAQRAKEWVGNFHPDSLEFIAPEKEARET